MRDFSLDQVAEPVAHVTRRHRQKFQLLRLHIAGDVVEQRRGIPPRARIGRKETEVGINTRRHRMVIAGAEMAVSPELLALPPDNHRHLCMCFPVNEAIRSEEHTSELQSLMRISYAVFCLKKNTNNPLNHESNL